MFFLGSFVRLQGSTFLLFFFSSVDEARLIFPKFFPGFPDNTFSIRINASYRRAFAGPFFFPPPPFFSQALDSSFRLPAAGRLGLVMAFPLFLSPRLTS